MATGNSLNNNIASCTGLPVSGLSLGASSAMIVTDNTGAASMTPSLANGQVVIGSTSGTPAPATLTAGSGISITNGAGSITIAATASGGSLVNVQYLTASSGTYTRTSGATKALVIAVGGGGGGGGIPGFSGANTAAVSQGGGAGAFCQRFYSTAPASASYTVGAGGPGGAIGSNNGTAGGNTTFNGDFTAGGGSGGLAGTVQTVGSSSLYPLAGASGGTPSGTYDLGSPGGSSGISFIPPGLELVRSAGGNSIIGPGAAPGVLSGSGANATSYGSGGSGAGDVNTASGKSGGNGAAGIIIVYEYA